MNQKYNPDDMQSGFFYRNTSSNMMTPEGGRAVGPNVPVPPIAPEGGQPVAPGPNRPVPPIAPEGGQPVYPNPPNIPVPPIAPEGGQPVYPGPPNIPVPPIAPEGGQPVYPGPPNIPVPPIAPEGGQPVYPGNPPIIPIPPIVINYSRVRILHAASNYVPINVTIGNRSVATELAFGKVSDYSRITDGFRTVSVYSAVATRTPLLTATIPFVAGTIVTLAVVNTPNGLELVQVSDAACESRNRNRGCFRVANLTFDDGPFDIILNNGRLVFSDVRTKEVTPWKQAMAGGYDFLVTETPYGVMPIDGASIEEMPYISQGRYSDTSYLLSFYVNIEGNKMYTAYIIGGYYSITPLQVIVLENR